MQGSSRGKKYDNRYPFVIYVNATKNHVKYVSAINTLFRTNNVKHDYIARHICSFIQNNEQFVKRKLKEIFLNPPENVEFFVSINHLNATRDYTPKTPGYAKMMEIDFGQFETFSISCPQQGAILGKIYEKWTNSPNVFKYKNYIIDNDTTITYDIKWQFGVLEILFKNGKGQALFDKLNHLMSLL